MVQAFDIVARTAAAIPTSLISNVSLGYVLNFPLLSVISIINIHWSGQNYEHASRWVADGTRLQGITMGTKSTVLRMNMSFHSIPNY